MNLSSKDVEELRAALWERADHLAKACNDAFDPEEQQRTGRYVNELMLLYARLGEALAAHPDGLDVVGAAGAFASEQDAEKDQHGPA